MPDTTIPNDNDIAQRDGRSSREWTAIASGARTLKGIAAAAAVAWLVAAVFTFWTYWTIGLPSQVGDVVVSRNADRLRQGVAEALQGTWGWALVAVVAFATSLLLRTLVARSLQPSRP